MDPVLLALQKKVGLVLMGQPNAAFQKKDAGGNSLSVEMAMDAQPQLVTLSNAGIPSYLSTFVDPKLIEILVAPMKAAEIVGSEVKKGDWTLKTVAFPVVESTGETSSYGDYDENGQAGANTNFPNRQSYHYQVMTQWGEQELEMAALARIDWANRLNIASVLTLNKFQNKTYFFGVEGLLNFGMLNDPNLLPFLSPAIKKAGGTEWLNPTTFAPNATALEVLFDIQMAFANLQHQLDGNIELDSKMTLSMSPVSEVALTFTNEFKVNVADLLKKNFPNMTVKTAPEYATAAGNIFQLVADEIEGQRTWDCAFTEKLRAHPIVIRPSSFVQKKSQGTWGTVIYRPVALTTTIGI